MNVFNFNSVPNIISGSGKLDELEIIFRKLKILNPILITDQGIKKLGYIKNVENILAKTNTNLIVFDDVKADPPEKNIFDAVKIAKKNKCDAVIGLGGGSSMDVAKAVSYFSVNDEAIKKVLWSRKFKIKKNAFNSNTYYCRNGSEVTNIAIFTLESTQKMGIVDPILYADYVILDAKLTLKLPNTITAYSGIDAMVHAIEAYTTRLKKNPISDSLAREALYLLGNNIKLVNKEPNNIKAERICYLDLH